MNSNTACTRLRGSICAGILIACLQWSSAATAATYYVAPNGSDSNSGGQAQPFRQIGRAVAAAIPGDTILVADGIYLGFDVRNFNASPTAPLTIRAIGSGAEVVPTSDRSDNRDTIYITFSNNIVVDGLRSFRANRAAVRIDQSHGVTIRNGVFGDNAKWGIFTNHSNDTLLEFNRTYGSVEQHGVYISNSSMRPWLGTM